MTREVILTETARQQMNAAADWYAEQNPSVAAKWFNGLISRLNALSENPEQYSVARESEFMSVELRQMLYGSGKRITHRVLFVIREQRIVVYQIRHVSMRDITAEDL
ncbi:MAG: type II toxin-antitoxin system RelE/ParE family toxin [Planctomycetaceae bacterium]|nr:type II toxin-antitoxin system RelE/ParE family toxin [Planctomycetaceae bacterium]